MYEFNYKKAASLEEASSLFKGAEDAKYLSGGMTLLPTLKLRLAKHSDLIDLADVPDLNGIAADGKTVSIRARTPHAMVAVATEVQSAIPALAKLAGGIGDPMVRNRGTIGGSIANSDPAADYPAAIVGLSATIHTDQRTIAGDDFFKDLFETALEPGELITQVDFTIPDQAGYMKFPNPASRYCIVGVMVSKTGSEIRVGVTGAGPCAFRIAEMETALAANFAPEAIENISVPDTDFNSDIHASAEYRAHLVTVMAKRAVAEAVG